MFRKAIPAVLLTAVVAAPAAGQGGAIFFFEDPTAFHDFMQQPGEQKFLKGIETFEESNIGPGGKQPLPAPLEGNIPNAPGGIGFPQGLAEKNIIIQDNIFPGPNPPDPMPSGDPAALYVIGPGFLGSNSKKVGEDLGPLYGIVASLDLIFTEPNHTGVGFWLSRFQGYEPFAGWHMTIYNKLDEEIGKYKLPAPTSPEPNKQFFGVWSQETIGRINIWDQSVGADGTPIGMPDAVDDIEMWLPEPATLSLLALGGLALLRRRVR